jgi:hypothetical protein
MRKLIGGNRFTLIELHERCTNHLWSLIMLKSISTVSVLAAVFAIACGQTTRDVRDGSLEFVMSRAGADAIAAPAQLTVTGLDNVFSARLQVTGAAGNRRLSLPGGLYAVNVLTTLAPSDAGDVVVSVRGAPALVVVAPGCLSTVNLHEVEDSAVNSALAGLESAVR